MNIGDRPIWQKGQAKAKKPKGLRQVSAKRAKRKATEKSDGAWQHMEAVKSLPCITCGHPAPSYAHHVTGDKQPRSDWRVIPLCYECHQGRDGYHAAKRSWVAKHGPDYLLLDQVAKKLSDHAK